MRITVALAAALFIHTAVAHDFGIVRKTDVANARAQVAQCYQQCSRVGTERVLQISAAAEVTGALQYLPLVANLPPELLAQLPAEALLTPICRNVQFTLHDADTCRASCADIEAAHGYVIQSGVKDRFLDLFNRNV